MSHNGASMAPAEKITGKTNNLAGTKLNTLKAH